MQVLNGDQGGILGLQGVPGADELKLKPWTALNKGKRPLVSSTYSLPL